MRYGFVRYYDTTLSNFRHGHLVSLTLEEDEAIVSVETLQHGDQNGRSAVRIWIARQAPTTTPDSADHVNGAAREGRRDKSISASTW